MSPKKNPADHLPVYYRLQQELTDRIESGHWEPGAAIPPERRLAEQHGVSIGTVKKALLNMVQEGYLYRVQGRGTFVSGTSIRRESLRYYRFLPDFGCREADLKMKFLSLERTEADAATARLLKTRSGQPLWRLERIFESDGEPLIYTLSLLPVKTLPTLDGYSRAKWEKKTLYEAVEEDFGLTTVYNHELFSAVAAEGDAARRLKVAGGDPLMLIRMRAFTYRDKPYEYRHSWCLTDDSGVFREF